MEGGVNDSINYEILEGPRGQVVIKRNGKVYVPLAHYVDTFNMNKSIVFRRDVIDNKVKDKHMCDYMRALRPDVVHPNAGTYRFIKLHDLVRLIP